MTSYDPSKYARVVTLDEFAKIRESEDLGVVVATSGGYDPIHPGHITCLVESRQLGDTLVAIVNGDSFLRTKKGRPFQDLETRAHVVAGIRGVDFVVMFEQEGDTTVAEALRVVRPKYFTKGGDRVKGKTMPESEEAVCREFQIELVDGVGRDKAWSSSDFLAEWGQWWAETKS